MAPSSGSFSLGVLSVAGLASIGAGAVHATAAGMHNEHRQALWAFIALAAFQMAWGVWTLVRSGRLVGLVGAGGNAVAVAGWVMAKVTGISFIDGLEESEGVRFADTLAAALAAVAVVISLAVVGGVADRVRHGLQGRLGLVGAVAVAVMALVVPGMASAGSHDHDPEDATDRGGHGHGEEEASAAGGEGEGRTHGLRPYDPTKPIDLGGVEGVTPEQQAQAENLLAWNVIRLPQWADPAVAEAHDYHSIGDAATGYEHYINWSLIDDGRILDPDRPESLVYQRRDGVMTLVAAMYMLPRGSTFDDVPDIGGPLMQWHIHNDLCFSMDPVAPKVAGVVPPDQECRPGTQRLVPVPMIHIWIVPHRCGPFSALEGVAGGQVREGEERLCDHVHGA